MPNYDFICEDGHQFEKYIPLTEWKDKLRIDCEHIKHTASGTPFKCGKAAQQDFLPRGVGCTIEPFVYYLNAAGQVRIPGSSNLPTPPGHTRCEVTTLHELRKLEGRCSREEQSKLSNRKEYQEAMEQAETSENRRELRAAMEHMSPAGKEFARLAMERGNARRPPGYSHDLGFHLGILHNDERR